MGLAIRHLRRLHSIPEVVSSRDLFKQHQKSNLAQIYRRSIPTIQDVDVSSRTSLKSQRRYQSILEELCHNPELEPVLRIRTERVQSFIGSNLPLEFPELLSILCGLSNMNIRTSPPSAGSKFGDVLTQQDALRHLGARFFEFHCSHSLFFSDINFLSCSAEEIEQTMAMFNSKEKLIMRVLSSSDLSECVIPFRGVHSAGLIHNRTFGFRKRIKAKTCVGSFYSMLGILVRKFGSEVVLKKFWYPKMLHPTNGLLSLVLKGKY